jgi:hypothetical protein
LGAAGAAGAGAWAEANVLAATAKAMAKLTVAVMAASLRPTGRAGAAIE